MLNRGVIRAIGTAMQCAVSPIRTSLYYVQPAPTRKINSCQIPDNDECPCGSGKKFKRCHKYYRIKLESR